MINSIQNLTRLLITTDTAGGVWDYSIELAKGITGKGIQVLLAAMGPKPDKIKISAVENISNLSFAYSPFKLEWMENPWENIEKAGDWLMSLNLSFNPDIIHLNQYSFSSLNWGAPVLVAGHSDVIGWYEAVHKEKPENFKKYHKTVQKGLIEADMVTAPSLYMLESLQKNYGSFITAGHIYNGRNAEELAQPEMIDNKESFILTAGRIWDEGKNITALDKAAPNVIWKIRAAGMLEDGRNIKKLENLDHLGPLSPQRLYDYMNRAAIYALPAKYEPFGLSILEAAICGCALVIGDIPSLREIWGDSAVFVNPESSADIADNLNKLINNKELLDYYSRKAREKAAEYSSEKMVNSYLDLYAKIMNDKVSSKIAIDAGNQILKG